MSVRSSVRLTLTQDNNIVVTNTATHTNVIFDKAANFKTFEGQITPSNSATGKPGQGEPKIEPKSTNDK